MLLIVIFLGFVSVRHTLIFDVRFFNDEKNLLKDEKNLGFSFRQFLKIFNYYFIFFLNLKSIKSALEAKKSNFNELKRVYTVLSKQSNNASSNIPTSNLSGGGSGSSSSTSIRMPNFIEQKMDNLVKRWNELESSNNTYNNDNTIDDESSRPRTLNLNQANQQATLPLSKSAGSTISSSSPSSPPRYSDDITPTPTTPLPPPPPPPPKPTLSMELISTMTTTVKQTTTTTETITTHQEEETEVEANETEEAQFAEEEEEEINNTKNIRSSSPIPVSPPPFVRLKTSSIDSIKSKTIVTPFELEPNNADEFEVIAKELSIIKLTDDSSYNNNNNNNNNVEERTTTQQILTNLLLNDDTNEANNRALLDITKSKVNNNITNNYCNDDEFSVQREEVEKRLVTDALTTTTTTTTSTANHRDDIDLISNDLFDWLLWIDHTLESQLVTVGDLDEINQAIQKYDVKQNLNFTFYYAIYINSSEAVCYRVF
jgi:hypothetical protein